MANTTFDPNARYNMGPNAAGCGRVQSPTVTVPSSGSLATDGVLVGSEIWRGFSAAGEPHKNPPNAGPNVAGAPRSVNNT